MNRLKELTNLRTQLQWSPAEVLQKLDTLLATEPNDCKLLRLKAQALDRTGDTESALAILNELIRSRPHVSNAKLDRAYIFHKVGRLEDAADDALAAVAESENVIFVHLQAANLFLVLGRHQAAADCYENYWWLLQSAQFDSRWGEDSEDFARAAEPMAAAINYCMLKADDAKDTPSESFNWLANARRLFDFVIETKNHDFSREQPALERGLFDHISFDYSDAEEIPQMIDDLESQVRWRHGSRDATVKECQETIDCYLSYRNLDNCCVITACTSRHDVRIIAMQEAKVGSLAQMQTQFEELVATLEPCDEHASREEATFYSLLQLTEDNDPQILASVFARST